MAHLILVLGMHRSGTSVVAKALTCMGAELGPRAEWSGPDNPKGFWEDQDVLAFNDQMLRFLDRNWADPRPIEGIEYWMNVNYGASHNAGMLLRDRLARFPLFGLKEPRMCRLLPLWRRAIGIVGCQVSVVHVIRHPVAVASSLLRRNGMPLDHGFALWLEYVSRQFADVDPAWPSVTVCYDEMMTLPQDQIGRIGRALKLTWDRQAAQSFARDYVDVALQHEESEGDMPVEVATVWKLMMERTGQ